MKADRRYSAIVGVLFLLVGGFALYQTLTSGESGTLGFEGNELGARLEPFAVPRVGTDLEGDANIDPDEACAIDDPRAIRVCDYYDRPLLISFWFTRAADCVPQQDAVEVIHRRFGDRMGVISINVRDDREDLEKMVSERNWTMPVGHDRDGAVSNLYRVGGCPTLLFARPGGEIDEAVIGPHSVEELAAKARALIGAE